MMLDFEYYNHPIVFALVRIILGILFFSQAYDKVFRIGLKQEVDAYELPVNHPLSSNFFVWSGTIYTSYCELIGGVLLILGLFTNCVMYLLAIDMVIATLGFCLQSPLFDMKFVWNRLVMLGFLLVAPIQWNLFSLDKLFGFIK